jgi:hypothetical protein
VPKLTEGSTYIYEPNRFVLVEAKLSPARELKVKKATK